MILKIKTLSFHTHVCFSESPLFEECLIIVMKAIQLLATLYLPISVKFGEIAYQIETYCISSITLTYFMLSSQEMFVHSFHEVMICL
jgi:hypothetical protein